MHMTLKSNLNVKTELVLSLKESIDPANLTHSYGIDININLKRQHNLLLLIVIV